MKEIIDLSSDDSTTSKVTTSSVDKSDLSDGNVPIVITNNDIKRKRTEEEAVLQNSSPIKVKKENTGPIVDDTFVSESSTVVNYTATKSTIRKKNPLEEDDSITTIVTERVAVSSPRGAIRKKVPLEDDEDLVLLTSPHMSSPLKDAMKSAFDSDRKEANRPPWWYNLGTDISDDFISKLKNSK
jgi:hypothetical protein